MSDQGYPLLLKHDIVELTKCLVEMSSVSGEEDELANYVEATLRLHAPLLETLRNGNTIVARSRTSDSSRTILASHLDTVPDGGSQPRYDTDDAVYGRGSVDMKGGLAAQLLVATSDLPAKRALTFVFYDNEEVASQPSGLERLAKEEPEMLSGQLALVLEPTSSNFDAGCQGALWCEIEVTGTAGHTARPWQSDNAIHAAAELLSQISSFGVRDVFIDGLRFRESISAVMISGGDGNNVVPATCCVRFNYRFAPDKSVADALAAMRRFFADWDLQLIRGVKGAHPRLSSPAVRQILQRTSLKVRAKYGWTDVARFAELGIPAVNFGPGDPDLAHSDNEHVSKAELRSFYDQLKLILED